MLGRFARVLAFFLPLAMQAQQDPQFGQYMMNPQIWNPSHVSINNQILVNFHHRTQWLGYSTTQTVDQINPPSTQLFTFSMPLARIKSGIGAQVMNDNIGPIRNLSFNLSYAYSLELGIGKLAAGLGIGAQSISINTNMWRPENTNDATLAAMNTGTITQMSPNVRFGLSYATDNLYLGLAANHVYAPDYTFSSTISSQLVRHYYLQGAYKVYLTENLTLQPSVILKSITGATSLEVDNLFLVGKFWAGVGYRTADAAIILAGVQLLPDNSLRVGYNIDFSVINRQAKSLTSHEIFLSYNLGSILDNRKPIIRSPRFRY